MYGKVLKLYYDNQGNIIEDTLGIAGDFSEYEIYVNKSKDLITVYGRDNNVFALKSTRPFLTYHQLLL